LPAALPWSHALLALAVVAIWGSNFVVIRVGLDVLPPLLFAALRFTFAALPMVFLLKRPGVPWRHLAGYGLLIGAGQFGVLFIAMDGFISPGLASLVVQTQVFFTIGLSIVLAGERVRGFQWAALALATAGILVIAAHTDATTTPLGLALVLLAAACWASGNMIAKASGPVNMVAYVAWSSLFAAPPLFALALAFEGWPAMAAGLAAAGPGTWAAVLWQTVGNSLFGYAAWGWLLSRHPAATVTPMALLVPVFGIGTSALVLGEPLPAWKVAAAALVIGGLAIGVLWPMVRGRMRAGGVPVAGDPS
jgi:O-acetylserine/cysteine efflux transporter